MARPYQVLYVFRLKVVKSIFVGISEAKTRAKAWVSRSVQAEQVWKELDGLSEFRQAA